MSDAIESTIESRMYPSSTPPAEPAISQLPVTAPPATVPTTVEAAEAAIVDRMHTKTEFEFDVPDEIKALRDTPERRMYDRAARPEINSAIADGLAPEAKAAVARELTRMADDIGVNADDITSMTMAARRMALEPPTAEQVTDMQVATVDALNAEFGTKAKAAHAATVALVARDPRVALYLAKTGLGNDAETVVRLARLAMRGRP